MVMRLYLGESIISLRRGNVVSVITGGGGVVVVGGCRTHNVLRRAGPGRAGPGSGVCRRRAASPRIAAAAAAPTPCAAPESASVLIIYAATGPGPIVLNG